MDTNKEIAVTVLMPAYNATQYLGEAIESILKQTYKSFYFLIINDGSSDNTEQVILDYQKKDDRIQYVKNKKNLGLVGVLAKGINLTNTQYLVRMDADDIALPNRLALQIAFMEANQDVIASGGAVKFIGKREGQLFYPKKNHEDIVETFFFSNPMVHPTMILRNDLLKKYNLNYRYPTFLNTNEYVWPEDYALWYELSKKGKLANIEDVILEYRIGEQSISIKEKGKRFNRYANFFTYLFSDLEFDFTKKDIKIHTEFALGKQANYSPSEYQSWINHLLNSIDPSKYRIEKVQKLVKDKWDRLSYRFADKGFFSGLKCLANVQNKVTFLKYIFLKSIR